jgi:hypothetical protein
MHQLITRLEHQNAKFSERAPTSNSNSLHSNLERVIVIYTIYPKLYREKCGVDNLIMMKTYSLIVSFHYVLYRMNHVLYRESISLYMLMSIYVDVPTCISLLFMNETRHLARANM